MFQDDLDAVLKPGFITEVPAIFNTQCLTTSLILAPQLDQHPACRDRDYVNDLTAAHRHQLVDHIDHYADMVGDDPYDISY